MESQSMRISISQSVTAEQAVSYFWRGLLFAVGFSTVLALWQRRDLAYLEAE
jgi:hypothetical protein